MKKFLVLGLALLLNAGSKPPREIRWTNGSLHLDSDQIPVGKKGFAIMRLRAHDAQDIPDGAREIKEGDGLLRSFLVPVNDSRELDAMAVRSHESTNVCGAFDYFPLNYPLATTISHAKPYFPAEAQFSELPALLERIQLSQIDKHLDAFVAALPTRYHRHEVGQTAGQKLYDLWDATDTGNRFAISQFSHSSTPQKSVIARLEGDSPETIIIGAHLDSIASASGNNSVISPGADDDASGIAVLTELMRVISTEGLRFHKSIELHGYAAEEAGLIGSREVAVKYTTDKKAVEAMMQVDMTYYSATGSAGIMHFLDDFSSLDLRRNAISWVKQYLGDVYKRSSLPKGTASDHKSWWEQGYPTLFAFENPDFYNEHVHSEDDTREKFDDGLLTVRIARLGFLFLAHQAGLKTLDAGFAAQQAALASPDLPKDLYIALQGTAENATFSVSAPATTEYLEFCRIDNASDHSCTDTRQTLTDVTSQDARKVFSLDQTFAFAAGERWRIYAYDSQDHLIARRQLEWAAP